jgi:uncharacterized iron-regulated membrane protein
VAFAPLAVKPGRTLVFSLSALPDPATGITPELADDQVFVNPYSGAVVGARKWGEIGQGVKNLMPFVYRLHYQLALGGVGGYVLGVVALLWTLDCFVGAWLTFPARRRSDNPRKSNPRQSKLRQSRPPAQPGGRPWLARWKTAWQVRWRGGRFKLNYDLHRAGGLWLWAMLFVLAWSSVAFNLTEVYDPVMQAAFAHQADAEPPPLPAPKLTPALGWHAARDVGRRLMAGQARAQGFSLLSEYALLHDPRTGVYRYSVISSRDVSHRWGSTRLAFDADTGAFRHLSLPTGVAAGDTIRTWLTTLHMAAVGGVVAGVPMQVFLSAMGLGVAMLAGTGVIVWWRKRKGRRKVQRTGSRA